MKNTMMVLLGLCSAVALSGCNDSKTDTSNPQIAETTPVAQAVSAQLGSGLNLITLTTLSAPKMIFTAMSMALG